MTESGILLGFFQSLDDARLAAAEVRRKGIGRAALIHKPEEGKVRVRYVSPRRGAIFGVVAGLLIGAALGLLPVQAIQHLRGWAMWAALGGAAAVGGAIGYLLVRLLRLGVRSDTVERYSRWLIGGETLLIVEPTVRSMDRALTLLRSISQSRLAVFAMHQHPAAERPVEPLQREPLTITRLKEHARRLASGHQVETQLKGQGEPLLAKLDVCQDVIEHVHRSLEQSSKLEQGISPSSEWLLDNAYIVLGQIRDVRLNLPQHYYHQLPVLSAGISKGQPRVYNLAAELVSHTDGRLDRENISEFIEAYQSVSPLNIGELWALPMMLRIALLETVNRLATLVDRRLHDRESADFWANRLLTAARQEPNSLPFLMSELATDRPDAGSYFAFQLTGHLYDEESALAPAQSWLERKLGHALSDIIVYEQGRLAGDQISIANAITSLRHLSLVDWREIFEEHSQVEWILRQDPAGLYDRCDFNTRDSYRHVVEAVAKRSEMSQSEVAHLAVELAGRADAAADPRRRHVGYFLVGQGVRQLESAAAGRPARTTRLLRWVYAHHTGLYLGAIATVSLLAIAAAVLLALAIEARWWMVAAVGVLSVLPASELAVQIVNYLVSRLLPPRALPKLDYEKTGLPDDVRTLVVVPMMLLNRAAIVRQARLLEVNFLANPDPNLSYGLFSDYCDAKEPEAAEDLALLAVAAEEIRQLNARHGQGRFFLFHRSRVWTECEQRFIGWERKRGKLEELNRLINGQPSRTGEKIVHVGDPDALASFRYVITLDADTRLPRDTARRLVETMAHPLNAARPAPDGCTIATGYTIIQPRVSTALPSATATLFSRLFTDPTGTDPYTKVISDVYQDLAAEGSYHGKGIYDPRAFHDILGGRFPEQSLLSHDLIEGCHVRCGLASDVELLDEFPSTYLAYASRQHRWVRGDWQIANFCLPRVSYMTGDDDGQPVRQRQPNPLSGLNRWKIFDNLRRSLVPAAAALLLLVGWITGPAVAILVSALVAALLLFGAASSLLNWACCWPPFSAKINWQQFRLSLARALLSAMLLPHQAALNCDAIVRVAYRRWVSRRRLLEWTSAQVAHWEASRRQRAFLLNMAIVSLFAVTVGAGLFVLDWVSLLAALPFLLLWLVSPLGGIVLNYAPPIAPPQHALPLADRRLLRLLSRQTWRYFDQFVGPNTHWMPPDNYQVSHLNELAMRTSPTNIGLWMLTCLTASDLGYITTDDAVERVTQTMDVIDRLEKFQGHLINWYDLRTLEPLHPKYISAVDSGNLLGGLWALQQGLRDACDAPLIGPAALDGLADTFALLREEVARIEPNDTADQALAILQRLFGDTPSHTLEIIGRVRLASSAAGTLADALRLDGQPDSEAVYWADQVKRQVDGWAATIDRYLGWLAPLAKLSDEELSSHGPEAVGLRRRLLDQAPSLRELAGQIAWAGVGNPPPSAGKASAGRGQWVAGFARARQAARAAIERIDRLVARIEAFGDGMDMAFLYDPVRRLFSVGYNLADGRRDNSFYDLLASEARLASFVAIARGEVPAEHWLSMGRPYGSVFGHRVLMSWSGTMFEYLMPLLFMRSYENSLLDQACRHAVDVQVDFGRRNRVPWGVSEAAFSALDANKTYQYRAFGVPGLGLKRGLEEDLVVAPYACALALPVRPEVSMANLKRLIRSGMRGNFGFYESIDYSRQRRPGGERGVIVHAFMAHHQAMALLAFGNFLTDQLMQRRFHRHPRVRATEPLLYERIPVVPPLFQVTTKDRPPARLLGPIPIQTESRFSTANTLTPKTQIQSNGRYSLMVTNSGGGYSRWKEFDVTRWRADTTRDNYGTFVYLRDVDSRQVWSAGYQPTAQTPSSYHVHFAVDHTEIRRTDFGIETITDVVLSPEDDAEVRRVTVINRTNRPRRLQVTSYAELALAPHASDRFHPAFSKMFVQTQALPARGVLLAWRRRRDHEDEPIWAAHLISCDAANEGPIQYETDRYRFLGRGHCPRTPAALAGDLTQTTGTVLDPIFAIRRQFTIPPGGRVRLAVITLVGESREAVMALTEKYLDLPTADRALELAWTRSQLELRHLRVHPEDAHRFQQLASHMLFPNAQLRPSSSRLRQNRLGQQRLWPHGISGDLPIVVITIGEMQDMTPVREVLLAHTYWRMHGLKADLVVLNEQATGYESSLQEHLSRLIHGHAMHTGVDQPGGVFLRRADQLSPDDLTLLLAAARVVLVAARGPLAQQLSVPGETVDLPPRLAVSAAPPEEPSPPLPFLELPYFNGLGGFTPDGKEYAIYIGPHAMTPAPWVNVMANPQFGQLVSDSGSGFVWNGNSQSNRLTEWHNDPVYDPPSESIYIRDEESGVFWCPTPLPVRELDAYRTRHGAGYSVFEHNSHNVLQELLTFVPMDADGGAPVRVTRLRLRSNSGRTRRLSVTLYAEWALGPNREQMQMHVVSNWDARSQALLAFNAYNPDFGDRVAFVAASPAAASFTADRTMFLGRNGTPEAPAAMRRSYLSRRTGATMDPCAALQVQITLEPGQTADVVFLLGQCENANMVNRLVRQYRDPMRVEEHLADTRQWWDDVLDRVRIFTPEPSANLLVNRWLLYQAISCRLFARSALYQSGGAFGFRDQLQDVMAVLHVLPELAREQILRAAARQFAEGDVEHWWHPLTGVGVRTRCSDDLLWLPYVVAEYVRVTGDAEILDEQLPFLLADPLPDDKSEMLVTNPGQTAEEYSLFEHCRRAIERGSTAGPHGLPLIGNGDWNDGMNRVGVEGRGESVWLAWFLIQVLRDFAGLCDGRGEGELAGGFRARADALAGRVEQSAWDGKWYRRGYFDNGAPLGSALSQEAQIDSLPQSWAAITGAGQNERVAQALDSASQRLVREDDKMVLLFTPPFDRSPQEPGYIKGYPPGLRENGGQYTHAAIWLAMAYARRGHGDRAVEVLRMINPVEHTREPDDVQRYRVEPYVVAADVYSAPDHVGQGGWTWYTGSAGWMYRVWIEEVCGFKRRGQRLQIDPSIPAAWEEFSIRYRYESTHYHIRVTNPDRVGRGVAWVELDGRRLDDRTIPLTDDGQSHQVEVRMGGG